MDFYQKKLFHKISYKEYETIRICLSAREISFSAGEVICSFGKEEEKHVGILASGSASTIRYEMNGSRTILERLGPQDIFGEVLSFQNAFYESIFVVCDTQCRVLFFDYEHILRPCSKVCNGHQQLIHNMLQIISEKAILLGERVEVLSKRTIREKLLCYFSHLSRQFTLETVQIPFTMVDLADYLSVDRSAMSRELKRMKEDGLLTIDRRTVHLLSFDDMIRALS